MQINEPSEYYVSHFNGPHGPGGPNGPLYGKMVDDLKNIRNTVSQWKLQEESLNGERSPSLSCSEVIEKLAMIEAGVAHWHEREQATEYAQSQWEWQDRQDELETIELNRTRAGRGLLFARAMLATNQHVLWAALCILYVNREKYALRLLEECVDSVAAIPPALTQCFARLGLSDEESIRNTMKQGCL